MPSIEKSIDVNVSAHTAYDQWTQFEDFPKFMEGVHEVRQLDDTHLHWRAEVAGKDIEWDAHIVEQIPDQRIAWRAATGKRNDGDVRFEPRGDDACRVSLRINYDTEGALEKTGQAAGVPERIVEDNLQRFKDFIEGRGIPTGAWRGRVEQGREQSRS